MYSVVVTISGEAGTVFLTESRADYFLKCTTQACAGQSFYLFSDYGEDRWIDYGAEHDANIRIKAFTNTVDKSTGPIPVTGVTIDNGSFATIYTDESITLKKTVFPLDALDKHVSWSSSDEAVAEVSETGKVTPHKAGTAVITVTTHDGNKTASFTITVKQRRCTNLYISQYSLGYAIGDTSTIRVTTYPNPLAADELTWESSNPNIISVDKYGNVTGHNPGIATITVSIDGLSDSVELSCGLNFKDIEFEAKWTGNKTVMLNWKSFDTVSKVEISRPDGSIVATLTDPKINSYIDENFTKFGCYTIQMYYDGGSYSMTTNVLATAPSVTTEIASNGIKISWATQDIAIRYYVGRASSEDGYETYQMVAADITSNSFTDTSAKNGVTYKYVVAMDYQFKDCFYYLQTEYGAPTTIKYLTAVTTKAANTASGVKITWNKNSAAKGYYIYRKEGNGSYQKIATVKKTATSYVDKKAKNGTTYTYYAQAYSGSTKATYKSAKTVFASVPTIKSAKNSATKSIKVQWDKNTKATGYQISYTQNGKTKTVTVKSAKTVTQTLSKLTMKKTYSIRVRSYKTVSGKTYYSAWSATQKVTVKK